MNAPTGNFRDHPDYKAGAALCAANGSLPIEASAPLMRGYLDALPARQLDRSKANGPGDREPFTEPAPGKPLGNDREILAAIPTTVSITDAKGELLGLADLKHRYLHHVVKHCGGNVSMAARLLGEHRRTIERMLEKRRSRT